MDRKIQIIDGIDRIELFGNLDVNLNLIKEATGVEIIQRDNELVLMARDGSEEAGEAGGAESAIELAAGIWGELMTILSGGEPLDKQKVAYVINLKKEGISYGENRVGKDVICFTHKGKPQKPKTLGQKNYVESIRHKVWFSASVLPVQVKPTSR